MADEAIVQPISAVRLFHQRIDYDDGGIVEMVIWRVPSAVPPSKGDHRHFKGREYRYTFTTVEQLVADFWSDVQSLRGEK